MNICVQLLLYATVATKQERYDMREHWRYQRKEWVRRHIIDEAPPGYDDEFDPPPPGAQR